jgi:hypothetical protein
MYLSDPLNKIIDPLLRIILQVDYLQVGDELQKYGARGIFIVKKHLQVRLAQRRIELSHRAQVVRHNASVTEPSLLQSNVGSAFQHMNVQFSVFWLVVSPRSPPVMHRVLAMPWLANLVSVRLTTFIIHVWLRILTRNTTENLEEKTFPWKAICVGWMSSNSIVESVYGTHIQRASYVVDVCLRGRDVLACLVSLFCTRPCHYWSTPGDSSTSVFLWPVRILSVKRAHRTRGHVSSPRQPLFVTC